MHGQSHVDTWAGTPCVERACVARTLAWGQPARSVGPTLWAGQNEGRALEAVQKVCKCGMALKAGQHDCMGRALEARAESVHMWDGTMGRAE